MIGQFYKFNHLKPKRIYISEQLKINMKKSLFALVLLFLVCISFAKAEIIFPEFKEVYSLGDSLDSSFKISEPEAFTGLVKLQLVCANQSTSFFTSPISINANEIRSFQVAQFPLKETSKCRVVGSLENEWINMTKDSKEFIVTSNLNITITTNKQSFKPEETIRIRGTAIRANGKSVEGIASITIGKEGYLTPVAKGAFELEATLKNSLISGPQIISVEIKDNADNYGNLSTSISILPIPTRLEIFTNKETFLPDERLDAYVVLYDQSGQRIEEPVSLILYDSWGIEEKKAILNRSTETLTFEFNKTAITGEWWLYSYSEGFKARKFISLKELNQIEIKIENNTLTVINTGNTIFKKPIEIVFQSNNMTRTEIQEIELGLASEKKFELNAPEGLYNITVLTGGVEDSFSDISLTGAAIIEINDAQAKKVKNTNQVIVMVIVFALIALFVTIRLRRKSDEPIKVKKLKSKPQSEEMN